MKDKCVIKKLDEDDILEILVEYFQDNELKNYIRAQACLLGTPNVDLRFIAVFSNDDSTTFQHNFIKLDQENAFNGDHSFIKKNQDFQILPSLPDE